MKVGQLEILPVIDGALEAPAREILSRPGVDDPWACHTDLLDDGLLHMTAGGFLIRTGGRTILIDAGLGNINTEDAHAGRFLESLREYGVDAADVTDVLFTHLHYDHVGWASSKGQIVFPNATYRAHSADWAHFVTADDALPGAVKKLSPIEPQLELFDSEHTIAPGIDARPAPGHTPGTTLYIISSEGQRALMLGDIVHSVVELAEPDWQAIYDVDPAMASSVRNAIAEEAYENGDLVAAAHFRDLPFGRIVKSDGDRRWEKVTL